MISMFHVFGAAEAGEFGTRCAEVCRAAGLVETAEPAAATFAIAPRLTRRLPAAEYSAPRLGTLVFHPSVLPYHRGPDAVRWTLHLRERVSGVTWFWADEGLDTGEVCEQEPVLVDLAAGPGRNYHERFLRAGLRALARAVDGILAGRPRREPQEEHLASYETFLARSLPKAG